MWRLLALPGTIPANTGRIGGESDWVHVDRDHPREYGENSRHERLIDVPIGPSPRIRGELEPADSCVHGIGTIPANTGRITSSVIFGISDTDHPREYGENATYTYGKFEVKGPSPRIRGEFAAVVLPFICLRTIPANTGRICFQAASSNSGRDHPREYGENRGKE